MKQTFLDTRTLSLNMTFFGRGVGVVVNSVFELIYNLYAHSPS